MEEKKKGGRKILLSWPRYRLFNLPGFPLVKEVPTKVYLSEREALQVGQEKGLSVYEVWENWWCAVWHPPTPKGSKVEIFPPKDTLSSHPYRILP